MDEPIPRDALHALLDFHVAAGVDVALDEAPHDRFAEFAAASILRAVPDGERRPPPSAFAEARPPAALAALPPEAAAPASDVAANARAQAASAGTLEELRAILDAFDGCTLKASAKQLVFADGTPGSRVMFIGEAPGAEEDRTGKAFVGPAGRLLDRMLAAIGLDRSGVYIANVIPWRPPGNRTPTPQEVAICLPFTHRQIELAGPEILVTLGAPATQTVLGIAEGIMKARGRWHDQRVGALALRVLPMLHPAYLLRQPLHKRHAWRDLRALRTALDRSGELG